MKSRGVPRDKEAGGRAKAKARGYEKTHRPLGAPILRRDPTAPEKLHIVSMWEQAAKEEGVEQPKDLPGRLKRQLEARWHWLWETVSRWIELKTALQEVVSRLRLGQRGLRPFGSTRPMGECSGSTGARLRVAVPGVATKQRPLECVMHKLHQWFENERAHRHEVREKTILTRLKFELEYERDKQLVLEQQGSSVFNVEALEAIQKRLQTFQINNPSKTQETWFMKVVRPRIGATPRTGQKLSENVDRKLTDEKHLTTWATSDRFIHLVSRGTVEDLRIHVANPEEFIEHREDTTVVVVDATALWLKLRGEERVFVSESERASQAARKRISRAFKKLDKAKPDAVAAFEAMKAAYHTHHEENQPMVEAAYSSAGDKYRLSLINISAVEDWFKPSASPKPVKKKSILLVPSSKHVKIGDIDLETRRFKHDVEYKNNFGDTIKFSKGESSGNLLSGWIEGLLKFEPEERAKFLENIEIWGQPRAWTDEKVSTDLVDFLREQFGQCLVWADCLGSQWTDKVLLRAWLRGILWAPYAPEVTSTLQEPDTHEHSQLKALIRAVKSELHWALESEWYVEQAKRPSAKRERKYPSQWGPFECLYVIGEAYARFRARYLTQVPLEGLQATQMLRVRPTSEGRLELVTGHEPWSFNTLPGRGIPSRLAQQRDLLVENWENNVPPVPDWDFLEGNLLVEDDLPAEPEAEEPLFDMVFQDLNLTEHQKAMLKPPEERMKEVVFPKSIRDRATSRRKNTRKCKWASKFRGLFTGKSTRKWADRLAKGDREALESEAQGTARVKQPAAPKRALGTSLLQRCRANLKKQSSDRRDEKRRSRKPEPQATEACTESPWHKQEVRVVAEGLHEGKHGKVQDVRLYSGSEPPRYRLQVADQSAKGSKVCQILVDSTEVVLKDPNWVQPKPFKLDYRGLHPARREVLARDLAITNVELIKKGDTLELGTVHAMLVELEERVGFPLDTMLVEPTVAFAWARDGLEGAAAPNEEDRAFVERVKAARHLYIVVQSAGPAHYTLVEVHKDNEDSMTIEFRDSLRDPPKSAAAMVERILKNLGLVDEGWLCPPRCNETFQVEGWECGLWATRYIERSRRERRGEGRLPPASIADMVTRTNYFIEQLKQAGKKGLERENKAKAKAEAKAQAKAQAKAKAEARVRKQVEPVFASLEEALEAAKQCKKCLPTKFGTKGCRACMGEHFEQIRLKGKPEQ